MTKTIKYLRSLEEIKKELEENPNNIRYYMGYEGYDTTHEGSLEFVKEKIEEYLKKQNNESTKN